MEFVKRTFFKDDETAFQLHPPIAEYVDGSWPGKRSINCLHIWSCLTQPMPRPPRHMVGANSAEEARKTLSGNDLVKAGLIPKGSAA